MSRIPLALRVLILPLVLGLLVAVGAAKVPVTVTSDATPRPGTPYTGKGFSLTLPLGWTVGSLGTMTTFSSADGTAEVLVQENPVPARLSDRETQQALAFAVPQANSLLHQQLTPTYQPYTIGPLSGLLATASIGRSSAGISIAGVSDQSHAVLAVTLIFPAANKQVVEDAASVTPSIRTVD